MSAPQADPIEAKPKHSLGRRAWWLLGGLVVAAVAVCMLTLPEYCLGRSWDAIARRHYSEADWWLGKAHWLGAAESETVLAQARLARLRSDGLEHAVLLKRAERLGAEPLLIEAEWLMGDAQGGQCRELIQRLPAYMMAGRELGDEARWAVIVGLTASHEFQGATLLLDQWIRGAAQDPRPFYLRGELKRALRETDEALTNYETAMTLDPEWVEPAIARAGLLIGMRRSEEAIAIYESFDEASEFQSPILLGRAQALFDLGRFQESQSAIVAWEQLNPDSSFAPVFRSRCMEGLEDWAGIIAVLQDVSKRFPDDMEVNLRLARAYAQRGETATAEKHQQRHQRGQAAQLEFQQESAKLSQFKPTSDDYVRVAKIIYPFNYEDAEELLVTAISIKPDEIDALRMLSEIMRRRGDANRAREYATLAQRRLKLIESSGSTSERSLDEPRGSPETE